MHVDDASRAVVELAASQHGAFHRSQAAAAGFSNKRLRAAVRRGEFREPMPGVYTLVSTLPHWRQRLMVASLAGAVASHRAAAGLHNLDGCAGGVVEVSARRHQHGKVRATFVHRWSRTDDIDLTMVDGIGTTTVERTLVQLGLVVSAARVEKALDGALRDGIQLDSIERTLRRLWRPGPTGAGVLRSILEDPARSGQIPDSWLERVLVKALVGAGVGQPQLQYPVRTADGMRYLDLAYPEARLGIEGHSRQFHFGARRQIDDEHRDLELSAAGWEIIYLTWEMSKDPARLAATIRQILQHRAAA